MTHSKLRRIRIQLFGYVFSPNLLPTLATLILLPCLMSLGFWQLNRASQKRQIEKDYHRASQIIDLAPIQDQINKALRFQHVRISGRFDNEHNILLDNQTHKHQVGVAVLTPFIPSNSHKVLLVNRGFIRTMTRSDLPNIKPMKGDQTITGLINFPSKGITLKKESTRLSWPLLVQSIDTQQLSKILGKPIYPYVLLEKSPDSFIQDWHPYNFPAYRHTGYAVQWFLLSLTLLIIYIRLNISRSD